MHRPTEVLGATVGLLRRVPALVRLCGDDPLRIKGYVDEYPERTSAMAAMTELAPGSLLIAWRGLEPGGDGRAKWRHRLMAAFGPEEAREGGQPLELTAAFVQGELEPERVRWALTPPMHGLWTDQQSLRITPRVFLIAVDKEVWTAEWAVEDSEF